MCFSVSHTLVHHFKGEGSAVVAEFLFWVPGETDVIPIIVKGDVPQEDGDVAALGGTDKRHTLVVYIDNLGLLTLTGNHCVTILYIDQNVVRCTECSYTPSGFLCMSEWVCCTLTMVPLLL